MPVTFMYALDSNTLIYYFKDSGSVAARLRRCAPSEIGIPIIVLYEIETGIAKSQQPQKRRNQLALLLAATRILPFDPDAARHSAALRASMEAAGTPLGPLDTLIAGIALAQRATLVTNNTREFSRVAKLKLDNWI